MLRPFLVASALTLSVASAEERSDGRYAFGPGEQSTYRVAYLGLTAGTAKVTVGSEMNQWGHAVWPIVADARSHSLGAIYQVSDKFVTYWDHALQRTRGSELFAEENRKRRRQRIRLEGTSAHVTKQAQGAAEVEERHEIASDASDMAAVVFSLRNRELAVGRSFDVPIFTGARSFTLQATVERIQRLNTSMGEREVYKIRVKAKLNGKLESRRDMYAYLTTDESHLPVKIEAELLIGSVTAELTEYKAGRSLARVEKRPSTEGGS